MALVREQRIVVYLPLAIVYLWTGQHNCPLDNYLRKTTTILMPLTVVISEHRQSLLHRSLRVWEAFQVYAVRPRHKMFAFFFNTTAADLLKHCFLSIGMVFN